MFTSGLDGAMPVTGVLSSRFGGVPDTLEAPIR